MPQDEDRPSVEQRGHPRVPLVLPGLLMVGDVDRYPCLVIDVSESGAGLQYCGAVPPTSSAAGLAVEGFGSFEGTTVRDKGNIRGLRFLPGEAKRNQLVQKLTLFVEEGLKDVLRPEGLPTEPRLSLIRTTGVREKCAVRHITLRGVSLSTDQRPPVGELVRLGRMYGRVAKHHSQGVGVHFVTFVGGGANGEAKPIGTTPELES